MSIDFAIVVSAVVFAVAHFSVERVLPLSLLVRSEPRKSAPPCVIVVPRCMHAATTFIYTSSLAQRCLWGKAGLESLTITVAVRCVVSSGDCYGGAIRPKPDTARAHAAALAMVRTELSAVPVQHRTESKQVSLTVIIPSVVSDAGTAMLS